MENETDLHRAIRTGDVNAVRVFVNRGDDITTADGYGYTPLHYSTISGVSEITRIIIDALGPGSPHIDKRTPFHKTPLLLAATHNHYSVYTLLLAKGADPNAVVMFGQTTLHWVVRQGRYKFIKRLIKYGADVNWVDCFGLSPLRVHLHSTMDIKVTRLLVKNGADINETRFGQTSVLTIALYRWKQDRLHNFRYLMQHGADINGFNFLGDTALHFAAHVSAPEIVQLLVLRYGADITVHNKFGRTPYDIALRVGNAATIETIKHLEEMEIEKQMQALGI